MKNLLASRFVSSSTVWSALFQEANYILRGKKRLSRKFSVLGHVLIPKHELLPKTEAESLLKSYGIDPTQLPFILESDPVIREMDGKAGDVVRITRRSETSGQTVYYRYVVK